MLSALQLPDRCLQRCAAGRATNFECAATNGREIIHIVQCFVPCRRLPNRGRASNCAPSTHGIAVDDMRCRLATLWVVARQIRNTKDYPTLSTCCSIESSDRSRLGVSMCMLIPLGPADHCNVLYQAENRCKLLCRCCMLGCGHEANKKLLIQ
jgi:hypothetical protein